MNEQQEQHDEMYADLEERALALVMALRAGVDRDERLRPLLGDASMIWKAIDSIRWGSPADGE